MHKAKKNTYSINEEVTVNVNSIIKINLDDIGLNTMNLNSELLELAISKYLDKVFRCGDGVEPIAHKVKITSRSIRSKTRKITEK